MTTKPGDLVRLCFDAVNDSTRFHQLVPAHMSGPIRVTAVSVNPPGVRLEGGLWRRSWVRVSP